MLCMFALTKVAGKQACHVLMFVCRLPADKLKRSGMMYANLGWPQASFPCCSHKYKTHTENKAYRIIEFKEAGTRCFCQLMHHLARVWYKESI